MAPARSLRLTTPWHTRRVRQGTIDDIIGLLRTRTPIDERERVSIDEFMDAIAGLSDPTSETADPVHVTASAIVVNDAGDKVALHLHKRLQMWLQPGGHIEHGETPWEGALREAREETGLDVRHHDGAPCFVHLDVHAGPKGHTHLDLRYLVRAPETAMDPAEGESPDAGWFTWTEAESMADAGLIGALHAVKPLLGKD